MFQIMKRRDFIQNIIAGTAATTMVVSLGKKAQAYDFRVPSRLLYGARAVGNTVQLSSLDLTSSVVQDLSGTNPELSLESNERITGLTVLLDGTLVIATAPATTSQNPNPSRLLSSSQTLPALQGIDQSTTIESLCATHDGRLLSIVSLNQGTPPFRLATIDLKTGEVSFIDQLSLPEDQRFSNLTESPKGHLYATNMAAEDSINLVQIFLNQGNYKTLSQLSYNGKPLTRDISSQAYSPSDSGTFVLANPTYQSSNSVFWANEQTGDLEMMTTFAADKIAFRRS
jgi:hypothetical protein